MKNNKKKGFTLIELLVVIAILAILATVSIVGYTSFLNKAKMSVDQQLIDQYNTVIEASSVVSKPEGYDDLLDILAENGLNTPSTTYKNYSVTWLPDENVMVLVENGKVAYPEKYAGREVANVELKVSTKNSLDSALTLDGKVTVSADVVYVTYDANGKSKDDHVVVSEGEKTITIVDGQTLTAGGGWGAVQTTGNATLTLDGKGTLTCVVDNDGYGFTVFARDDSTVYITDGTYINDNPDIIGSDGPNAVIYARDKAKIVITGGVFKADGEDEAECRYTLNCQDNSDATITVAGGMFYKFDPSNANVGEGEIVIADGYTVVRCDEDSTANDAGDWYKVVKA